MTLNSIEEIEWEEHIQEVTGWSASYTVGSMTFKAHRNKGTNLGNAATKESEHTEVGVTFAF